MSTLHISRGPGQLFRPGRATGEIAMLAALWAREALERVSIWRQRARERRQLRELSPAMLHDIGLTPADVDVETAKPFWQL